MRLWIVLLVAGACVSCAVPPGTPPAGPSPDVPRIEAELRAYDRGEPLAEERGPLPWPPTTCSVGVARLDLLRRPAAPPVDGPPTVELPELPRRGADPARAPRIDTWRSFEELHRGRITAIQRNGEWMEEPAAMAVQPETDPFYRLLCLLEIDPERARREGVSHVETNVPRVGLVRLEFPRVVHEIRVGVAGGQRAILLALKMVLSGKSKRAAAVALLEQADPAAVAYAARLLEEEWASWPGERDRIAAPLLKAAERLGRPDLGLPVAAARLRQDPADRPANSYVARTLAGPGFNLLELAAVFFARAGRPLEQADILLEAGLVGGAEAVLVGVGESDGARRLRARVALARGDLEAARGLAEDGRGAAWHPIRGGIAYAAGDAASAERAFRLAVQAEPRAPAAYVDLGVAFAVQGKRTDASLCFRRAAELDPLGLELAVAPWLGEAFLLLCGGDATEAARALEAAVDADPGNLLLHAYLALALEAAGDRSDAAAAAAWVIARNYRYRILVPQVGRFRDPLRLDRAGRWVSALAEGEERRRLEKSIAWRRRGYARTRQNDVADAVLAQALGVDRTPFGQALLHRYILDFCPASRAAERAQTLWSEVDPALKELLTSRSGRS